MKNKNNNAENIDLWGIAPLTIVEVYRRFEGAYCLRDKHLMMGGSRDS
jgi:hypothetical protein